MRLDPKLVQLQIAGLKLQCPEMFEDDGDDMLLNDMLEGQTDLNEFLAVIEEQRQEATAMAAGIASRIAELETRQKRFQRREQAMRGLAFKIMQSANLRKLELDIATLSIRNGTPKVIVTDDSLLPDILCRIKREPDKKRIGEMLKAGQVVRGCELSNAEETLAIHTK